MKLRYSKQKITQNLQQQQNLFNRSNEELWEKNIKL